MFPFSKSGSPVVHHWWNGAFCVFQMIPFLMVLRNVLLLGYEAIFQSKQKYLRNTLPKSLYARSLAALCCLVMRCDETIKFVPCLLGGLLLDDKSSRMLVTTGASASLISHLRMLVMGRKWPSWSEEEEDFLFTYPWTFISFMRMCPIGLCWS